MPCFAPVYADLSRLPVSRFLYEKRGKWQILAKCSKSWPSNVVKIVVNLNMFTTVGSKSEPPMNSTNQNISN